MEPTQPIGLDALVAELVASGKFTDAAAAEKEARQLLAEQKQVRDTITARRAEGRVIDGDAMFERLIARAKARLSKL